MTKHLSEETIIDFIEKELNEQKANQGFMLIFSPVNPVKRHLITGRIC